jgi:hypothetical protein
MRIAELTSWAVRASPGGAGLAASLKPRKRGLPPRGRPSLTRRARACRLDSSAWRADATCLAGIGRTGGGLAVCAPSAATRTRQHPLSTQRSDARATPREPDGGDRLVDTATTGAQASGERPPPLSNGLSLVRPRPSTINPRGVRYASVRPLRLRLRGDRGRARTRRRLSSGDGPRPKTGAPRCRRTSTSPRRTPSTSPAP